MPTVLVTGANRGLGLEFTRQYAAAGWQVHAACRVPGAAGELDALSDAHPSITVHSLDVRSTASIERLREDLEGEPVDVLLNNAGQFGPRRTEHDDPGQCFGTLDPSRWLEVMQVNALAPLLIAQAFVRNVSASGQQKIVTVSSELGSIAGTSGGLYAYRMSKAAVNMAMASLARDLAPQRVIVALFCPGWVRTDMGGPQAPLATERSVAELRARIAALTPEASGQFHLYDGSALPW
jgi:NAD(P)-dependent dehydrogenase (short-subunit alcohol dehydrogenase family)